MIRRAASGGCRSMAGSSRFCSKWTVGRCRPRTSSSPTGSGRTSRSARASCRARSARKPGHADGFIVCKDKHGTRIVADGLGFTNEAKVDPSGRWLYVNETFGKRTSRFSISQSGLGKRGDGGGIRSRRFSRRPGLRRRGRAVDHQRLFQSPDPRRAPTPDRKRGLKTTTRTSSRRSSRRSPRASSPSAAIRRFPRRASAISRRARSAVRISGRCTSAACRAATFTACRARWRAQSPRTGRCVFRSFSSTGGGVMRRRSFIQLATALALAGVLGASQAQTVLKFSHTDQPGGARQRRPNIFAQEGREVHPGPLQGAGVSRRPARQRPEGGRAAPARRHRLHRDRHRHLRHAHPDAESHADALPRRQLRPGLEALRRARRG